MKILLASTALALAFATPAMAAHAGEKAEPAITTDMTADAATEVTLPGEFTDDHEWVGKAVYDLDMEKVGEVERVSMDANGDIADIVVETGGILDIGGKEVLVASDQYMLVTAQGDEGDAEIQLVMSGDVFADLPTFDEDTVTDYPLADNDLIDGIDESKGEVDVDVETDAEIGVYQ